MSETKYCLTLEELVELCQEIMTYYPNEDIFFNWSLYIKLWLKEREE